jgi:hypothetical protein
MQEVIEYGAWGVCMKSFPKESAMIEMSRWAEYAREVFILGNDVVNVLSSGDTIGRPSMPREFPLHVIPWGRDSVKNGGWSTQ